MKVRRQLYGDKTCLLVYALVLNGVCHLDNASEITQDYDKDIKKNYQAEA